MNKIDRDAENELTRWRIRALYSDVRARTDMLASPLSDADATVQSMPDASPAKWHLAHTSWFFESLVLQPHHKGYRPYDRAYAYLFNSYYNALGERHPRAKRGLLTRPTLEEVYAYRRYVDEAVSRLIENSPSSDVLSLIELGCNHEQQHQELLLTDILHLFAQNPLRPEYRMEVHETGASTEQASPLNFISVGGGVRTVGHGGLAFAFDAEGPEHAVIVDEFKIGSRPIVNAEWLEFMKDGGYQNPMLWLSDGWATVQQEGWASPLYWEKVKGHWLRMTLAGMREVAMAAPVTHISYYEADAFARWAGARLPTEFEWEAVAQGRPIVGNFADSAVLAPQHQSGSTDEISQLFGDVWEWTSSPFTPYPKFRAPEGPVGEYNGKFMSGQYVLRGGSCITPPGHMRATYRNFFPPNARWQFSGLRLAKDI